jgi:hypothetical protein
LRRGSPRAGRIWFAFSMAALPMFRPGTALFAYMPLVAMGHWRAIRHGEGRCAPVSSGHFSQSDMARGRSRSATCQDGQRHHHLRRDDHISTPLKTMT